MFNVFPLFPYLVSLLCSFLQRVFNNGFNLLTSTNLLERRVLSFTVIAHFLERTGQNHATIRKMPIIFVGPSQEEISLFDSL